MKRIIALVLIAGGLITAAPAAADSTGRSGRGVEHKTAPPAPKQKVPSDFVQKIGDAVRVQLHR